jgi:multimeric flavodoxin WrbA
MKVLAIQSSPNRDGLTASLAKAVLEGAEQEGAEVELVHLNDLDIEACRACGSGWGHHFDEDSELEPDECILEDDYADLRSKVIEAAGLVFCTPVYFWDLSETAKVFLDRLRRSHYPVQDRSPLTDKPVVGIAAAGGSGNGAAEATANLEAYLVRWMEMKRVATLPVTRQTSELHTDTARRAGVLLAETIMEATD